MLHATASVSCATDRHVCVGTQGIRPAGFGTQCCGKFYLDKGFNPQWSGLVALFIRVFSPHQPSHAALFRTSSQPNAHTLSPSRKLEELENEISQLKALLSSRPAIDQQATPANSMSSSIPQANPFDQLIGQSTSPLQNDATLENADLLSAHLSGGSTITRSSWQELPRDFTLSQGLSGESNATGRASFAWTDHQQVVEQGPQSEWIHNNATFTIRKTLLPDAVAGGLASHGDAEQWFQCFFEGSVSATTPLNPSSLALILHRTASYRCFLLQTHSSLYANGAACYSTSF